MRLLVLALACFACSEPKTPKVPDRQARAACPRGTFAAELDKLLPSLYPAQVVSLLPATGIDKKIEPGCVVPFRRDPDERLLDVGRVTTRTASRSKKGKDIVLGRGRLEIGRRALRLTVHNDAGDETLALTIDGAHIVMREAGKKLVTDVSLADESELPLPLDALVAALDDCGGDERLGRTEDGNIIEARRGDLGLWRSRWMDANQTAVIDTSYACTKTDARLVWRTAVGDLLPMLAVASARSDRVLVIARQGQTGMLDTMDYGFEGMR
jgi:hypothetical protein